MKEWNPLKRMQNGVRRIISLTLIGIMMFSIVFGNLQPVNAQIQSNQNMMNSNELVVQGENSFGKLISNEFEQKLSEQEANNGNNIFEITVEGTTADVSFETMQDCTVVVGIYDELGIKMLASGNKEVTKGETQTQVVIETDSMPDYFIVRGFLVESDTLSPLATAYESPNYTQEMQEFLSKTTDDFETERVLNLDDDKTNNFAVFAEKTKIIEETEGVNTVVSSDDTNGVYIIENADSSITSLVTGDIFAYEYDDTVLIVKVESVVMDGTTATITGAELKLEEVFEYVKIDNNINAKDAYVDMSGSSEGVTYEGKTVSETRNVGSGYDDEELCEENERNVEESLTYTNNFGFKDGGNSGNFTMTFTGTVKLYWTWDYKYVELTLDYSAEVILTMTYAYDKTKDLADIVFPLGWGLSLKTKLSANIKVDAQMEIRGILTGGVGFTVSNKNGVQNISKTPKFEPNIDAEGQITVKLIVTPTLVFISEKFLYANVSAEMGIIIDSKLKGNKVNGDSMHQCSACIDGTLTAIFLISGEAKFLNDIDMCYELPKTNKEVKLGKFYFSFDNLEFGLGSCPRNFCKIIFSVQDTNGNWREGVEITGANFYVVSNTGSYYINSLVTDSTGSAIAYLADGAYKLRVSCYNADYNVTVDGSKSEYMSYVFTEKKNSSSGAGGSGAFGGGGGGNRGASVEVGHRIMVKVIDKDGNAVKDAIVNDNYSTNEEGIAEFYLPDGSYTITASKSGIGSNEQALIVDGAAEEVVINIGNFSEDGIICNDETGIPDPAFYAAALEAADADGDGVLTVAEAQAISKLDAGEKGISDIRGIQYFTWLDRLYLDKNNINDISVISGLTNLVSLELDENNISNINVLSGLTKLYNLRLDKNNISDISALSGLTNLHYLGLDENNISDISALSGLINLQYLWLDENNISNISALSGLTNLSQLGLDENNISDISALSGLTNLQHLFLGENNINNISVLSGLIKLYILHLEKNNISDISALSGLTNLQYLWLDENNISNISALTGLTNLQDLFLDENNISNISVLTGLTKLRNLTLEKNNISDISALTGLINLYYLRLDENNISDISALTGLTDLWKLNLEKNNISDISALSGLINLEGLFLDENNISDISALSGLTNLQYLWLRENNISDFSPVQNLTKLISFHYSGNPGSDSVTFSAKSVSVVDVNFDEELYETVRKESVNNSASSIANGKNLSPNGLYNFYVLKSAEAENLLSSENLLYIGQGVADENGELVIRYEAKEASANNVNLLIGENLPTVKLTARLNNGLEFNADLNGSGLYKPGESVTIVAQAKDGYAFVGWFMADESEKGYGDSVISTENSYTFLISEDINLVAVYERIAGDDTHVAAFVRRLYELVLNREGEANGIESWKNALISGFSSGVDAGYGFVFSDECKERSLSNEAFVEMLYNTFMNRPSDEGGRSAWVSQLDAGVDREKIFEGFVYSPEFAEICANYGISVGNVEDMVSLWEILQNYHNQNADVTAFVARCYTQALGRAYDPVGLEDWCRVILTQEDTPTAVAKCFIFSDEFVGKGLSDEEYVKVLYRTFMGREADEGGLAAWIGVLQSGEEDREKVLEGFANSQEFAEILESFGLN